MQTETNTSHYFFLGADVFVLSPPQLVCMQGIRGGGLKFLGSPPPPGLVKKCSVLSSSGEVSESLSKGLYAETLGGALGLTPVETLGGALGLTPVETLGGALGLTPVRAARPAGGGGAEFVTPVSR